MVPRKQEFRQWAEKSFGYDGNREVGLWLGGVRGDVFMCVFLANGNDFMRERERYQGSRERGATPKSEVIG